MYHWNYWFLILSLTSWFLMVEAIPTMFLKEILQGRCYERPPTGDIRDCPSLVDGFMGIVESHRDADFTVETFDSYFNLFDFALDQASGATFDPSWHPFPSSTMEIQVQQEEEEEEDYFDDGKEWGWKSSFTSKEWVWKSSFTTTTFQDSSSWIAPEHIPSGSFLYGLTFCGIDRMGSDCTIENSNAYRKYWEALYGRVAANAKGTIQIIIFGRHVDQEFLQRGILDKLDPKQVDNVTIFSSDNCSTPLIANLQDSLVLAGVKRADITCSDDPIEYRLCALAGPNSKECTIYKDSCLYQHLHDDMQSPSAPAVNGDATKNGATPSTNDPISNKDDHYNPHHHHVSTILLVLLGLVIGLGICKWWWFPRDRGGWATTALDKMSDMTASSISTNSQRRRREQAVRESTALLEEVNRNLFMGPSNNSNSGGHRESSGSHRDMETVILQ